MRGEGWEWRNRELKAGPRGGQGNGKRRNQSEWERGRSKGRRNGQLREGEERNMGQEKLCAKKRKKVGESKKSRKYVSSDENEELKKVETASIKE